MKKPPIDGPIVYLDEIRREAVEFHFDRKDTWLAETLKPLIGNKEFNIRIQITPHGNSGSYSIEGRIQTEMELLCSRCAFDFVQPIVEEFHEFLMVDENYIPENSGQITPSELAAPYCTTLKDYEFKIDEFIHEILVLAEPLQPLGKENCDENCENYQVAIEKGWLTPVKPPESDEKSNPFKVLENLL